MNILAKILGAYLLLCLRRCCCVEHHISTVELTSSESSGPSCPQATELSVLFIFVNYFLESFIILPLRRPTTCLMLKHSLVSFLQANSKY